MNKACCHFRTITKHKLLVMRACFKMGLIGQGLLHDLSKYSPTEFLAGARYWQGDRSPNNAEREALGVSNSWLHHKGRNRHHFEYWIDYDPGHKYFIAGMPIPRRYVAEMIADRIGASRVYLGDAYTDAAPLIYYDRSRDKLWFVHRDVRDQLTYLLSRLACYGEEATLSYIRDVFLKQGDQTWTRPPDFDTIRDKAQVIAGESEEVANRFRSSEDSGNIIV